MRIENLLRGEIESEFEKLNEMEIGTEKYKVTVDGLVKLIEKAIDIEKIETEVESTNADMAFKTKQMEDENKDRFVKNAIAVAGIIVPVGVTIWGTLASFDFEKEGTVTTIMGRGFINKLLPKK
jgi:hypothetical protein